MKNRIKFKSYKSLENIEDNLNYLDNLAIEILETLYDMYEIPTKYNEYKNFFAKEKCLNIFFNEIKELLWMKFCNQIRDFSCLIYHLLKNKKYLEIKSYIEKTTFLSSFLLDFKKYSALSLTLHNFNKHLYGKEFEQSFTLFDEFNKTILLHKHKFNDIKMEFEKIIYLFRLKDGYNICDSSIFLKNHSNIFCLLDNLIKNPKS